MSGRELVLVAVASALLIKAYSKPKAQAVQEETQRPQEEAPAKNWPAWLNAGIHSVRDNDPGGNRGGSRQYAWHAEKLPMEPLKPSP